MKTTGWIISALGFAYVLLALYRGTKIKEENTNAQNMLVLQNSSLNNSGWILVFLGVAVVAIGRQLE